MAAVVGEVLEQAGGHWRSVHVGGDPLGLSPEQRAVSDRAAETQRRLESAGRPLDFFDRWLIDFVSDGV